MGTLLNRGGLVAAQNRYLLVRDKTSGVLRTSPWWMATTRLGAASAARTITWLSPNYYPSPVPGSYGRSVCYSGLLGSVDSTPWSAILGGGWAYAEWFIDANTGYTASGARASILLSVFDMLYWTNLRLKKIRYVCTGHTISAGAGNAMISLRTSSTTTFDTSLDWLYTDYVFTVPTVATHDFTVNAPLDERYLILCQFIDELAPATAYNNYPNYQYAQFKGYFTHLLLE